MQQEVFLLFVCLFGWLDFFLILSGAKEYKAFQFMCEQGTDCKEGVERDFFSNSDCQIRNLWVSRAEDISSDCESPTALIYFYKFN